MYRLRRRKDWSTGWLFKNSYFKIFVSSSGVKRGNESFNRDRYCIISKESVIWVALPDVADTQVHRLLQAELSVK